MSLSLDLLESLKRLAPSGVKTALGMRYGNPSIETAVQELSDCSEILFLPLYPQYALSSTTTAELDFSKSIKKLNKKGSSLGIKPFFANSYFIQAQSDQIKKSMNGKPIQHLLLSYHGLPERHVKKTDLDGKCLTEGCCERASVAPFCYRAQCFKTSELIAKELGLSRDKVTTSFQSRLGNDKWLEPSTPEALSRLIEQKQLEVTVACPSFVTDCLETLEEIGIRAKEEFLSRGGQSFTLAPCVNSHPTWVKGLLDFALNTSQSDRQFSPFCGLNTEGTQASP